MSLPLTDQRQRAELIAELYDLHATGLFAYCADQLGDLGSASDVLVSVLTGVPAAAPPRAALYALARREVHRRDILYSPPAVDPLIDPATSLVERSLRELRPHQREVLVLCAVCGLSKAELAWVLDVAPDTAQELAVGAGHRFRQSLGAALASTGLRVPKPVADIYGALGVAPLRDVLGRLPWPQPPGALRIQFAGSRTAAPAPLFVKPRWPSPPVWPQPLAEADPASSTMIFPAELLTPPSPSRVSEHEATTAPMPKLRDPLSPPGDMLGPGVRLRDPLGSTRAFRKPLDVRDPLGLGERLSPAARPGPPPEERPFFLAAPEATAAEPFATGDVILPKDAPDPYMTGDVLVHGGPTRPAAEPRRPERPRPPSLQPQPTPEEFRRLPPAPTGPARTSTTQTNTAQADTAQADTAQADTAQANTAQMDAVGTRAEEPVREQTAPLFQPRSKPGAEPVYRLGTKPGPASGTNPDTNPDTVPSPKTRTGSRTGSRSGAEPDSSPLAPRPVRARPKPRRRPDSGRPRRCAAARTATTTGCGSWSGSCCAWRSR
ncbi:RNA polymerase sigma factor [Nonomuraea antimicrobica]